MKTNKFFFFIFTALFFTFTACVKDKDKNAEYKTTESYDLKNIAYGSHNQQKMDIYLPKNRNEETKVFVLIHGGGWNAGNKSDFTYMMDNLKGIYPDYAIINLNYRLGSVGSPGYNKQIIDIEKALNHIQGPKYNVSDQYFLIGASAGAHLALLYGYAFDPELQVKGICNLVGPTDLTDPEYTENQILQYGFTNRVGPYTYAQNPSLFEEVSPVTHVSANSPATISFYGGEDPLIPSTQMGLLHNKLDIHNVYNEATMYPGEGHVGWSQFNSTDFALKLFAFINSRF